MQESEEVDLTRTPRWIEIIVGVGLCLPLLLCLAGSAAMLFAPFPKNPVAATAVGILLLVCSLWAITKAIQLVTGRSTKGGLFSPLALRIISIFFLCLPIGGLFTGYYSKHGLQSIMQAVTYVVIFGVLQGLARRREAGAESGG